MGPVTDERCSLLLQSRDDQLAQFAVRQDFSCLRIDDLEVEVVVEVMHAGLVLAVDGDARSVDLGQSVNVIELDAQFVSDTGTHLRAPAL